ncbi:MAG TPA: DUF411 domain-containing protein [Gammaproteobacteria bacterium]
MRTSRPTLTRSLAVAGLLALFASFPAGAASPWDAAQVEHAGSREITVYRSPSCGCCKGWIDHLRTHGFEVSDVARDDVMPIKQQLGLPAALASCHTAVIDGYVIEGHVPADDIKRLLAQKPAVAGLAVPEMPMGPPGMEMGARKDPFAVLSFDRTGNVEAFNQYWNY